MVTTMITAKTVENTPIKEIIIIWHFQMMKTTSVKMSRHL